MDSEICDCPEDWPADPPGLRLLDRSLRCGICQDIYTGPVVLVCGHSYCSRCIRDSLNVRLRDGQAQACPSCRLPCDQADLRPATHLREASQAWQAVRQLLLKHHICMLQQPEVQAHAQQQQQQQVVLQNHETVQATQQQQKQQQVHRHSLRHIASPVLTHQRRTATDTTAATEPREQLDAITISSNGEVDSDGEGGCSVASDAEVATAEDAGDPDWQDSDGSDDDVKQHRSSRQNLQPREAAGKRKLRSGHSSSSADDAGALSCSQPDGEAASGDEFDVRECKRPRSRDASDKCQQRRQLQDLKQPGLAAQSVQAGDKPVQQQQGQELQQLGVKQQQQQQQVLPGYVACPVCGLSVKAAFINTHVDSCLTRAGNTQSQAVAATANKKHMPVPPAMAAAAADKTASRGACHLVASATAAGSGHWGTAARRARNRKPLEPPPKLCFELMKDKVLKAKLASLGLSNEGDKKACVDRYTSFRSYILALRDDGKASISSAEAAADFTRQEKHKARAASRPQSLGALAAAVPSLSGGLQSTGAKQPSASGAVAGHVTTGVDNTSTVMDHSYAALIQETRARMALHKRQPGLQQEGTLQQPRDQCQQQGQSSDSMVIGEMGVLHSVQPEQPQHSGCVAQQAADVVQLAPLAVNGVERLANGS